MGIIWPWERKQVERELDSVENMLESMFKPVVARPSFTTDLRKRLVGKTGPLAKASLGTLELILLVSGAVVGLLVFIFTIGRSFLGLFSGNRGRKKRAAKSGGEGRSEPKKKAA